MEAGTAAPSDQGAGARPPGRFGTLLDASGPATPLHAAAAVLVATAVGALQVRLDWDAGPFLLLSLVGSAVVMPWALRAAAGRDLPDGAATAMLVAGLVLLALTVGNLADALGAEGGPGSTTWTALLFAALAAIPAWQLDSPVSALASSLALGVAFIAAVDWIFDPSGIFDPGGIDTFRWLLLLAALAYGAAAFALEGARPRHAVQHVSAAGLALLVLAATLYAEIVFGEDGVGEFAYNAPFGWELVALVGAAALIAYAVLRREPGPGYIGAIVLTVSATVAAVPESEPSVVGWPLLLVLLALAAVAGTLASERR